jgi:flagellar motor protein MotB
MVRRLLSIMSVMLIVLLSLSSAQAQAPRKKRPAAKPATTATTTADVQQLKDLVSSQQKQMEEQHQQMEQLKSQLQQLVDATQQANAAAQRAQTTTDQAQSTATQAQKDAAEAQRLADQASENAVEAKTGLALIKTSETDNVKRLGTLEGITGRFRWTGDVRVRGENYQQSCAACFDRNRARIRVRLGLEGRLGEDFTGGLAFATGSLGDPTTTNETLTNFFDRKTIGLDRGYITYQPVAHSWLQLTGGKFAYTWNRTSATFDPDINPEGFVAKVSFDLKTPVVKNFTVQAINLLYSENNNSKLAYNNTHDSFAAGGQVSSKLDFGFMTSTPSFTLLNWRNVDAILNASAFAVQATTTGNSPTSPTPVTGLPTPGEGPGCSGGLNLPTVAPCAFAANGMTNATTVDAKGAVHFLSGFLYADLILNNQIKTGLSRLPLNILLEYENNLDAAAHPLDAKGNPTTLGSQSHAYLIDVSVGQSKNKNDFQVGYAFERQEQDSILASFAESDQRAPTNILQNRIYAQWRLHQNVLASYTYWIGRTLNSNLEHSVLAPGTVAGTQEPYLRRMQFDLIYSF